MPQDVTIRWGPFEKHLTLTADQERLLSQTSPFVIISGPTGCGKSTVLMLKGLEWLQAGHDVIVFGLHPSSLPTCRLTYCLLSESHQQSQGSLFPKDRTWGRVLFAFQHLRDARDLETTLHALTKYGTQDLHVLMDDFCPEDGFSIEMMLVFMRELRGRVPGLHLWATNVFTKIPEAFDVHILTEPTRFPIPLMQEIKVAVEILKDSDILPATHGYSMVSLAATRHHPDVIHARHSGKGEQRWPLNSEKCGRQVAKLLKRIGVREEAGIATGGTYTFRDVLIISRNPVNPMQPPQAFLRGLESSGVPAQVFASGVRLEDALDHVILAKQNKVTLMNHTVARGLDRPVVVCLTGSAGPEERYELNAQDEQNLAQSLRPWATLTHTDASGRVKETVTITSSPPSKGEQQEVKKAAEHQLKAKMEVVHRLEIWSRASEQLIVIHLPKGVEAGVSGSENYGGGGGGRKCVIL